MGLTVMEYYNQPAHEVLKQLITSEKGLTSPEAAKRLARDGKNILKEREKVSPFKLLLMPL
ncbi:MAG: hypothetical protein JRI70_06290 [Deltaproteobacteria bacterium]|nr:hypothetical protein [Deltaproteobacteria bacterium]